MDMRGLIKECFDEIDFEKVLKQELKSSLENTLRGVISSLYGGRYSDFGRLLYDKLEKETGVNFDSLDLQQYNMIIAESLKQGIEQMVATEFKEGAKELVNKTIKQDLKDSYTLSEILHEFTESVYDNDISLYIDGDSRDGVVFVFLDEEAYTHKYDCEYKIVINCNKISDIRTKDKDFYSFSLKGSEFNTLIMNICLQRKRVEFDLGLDKQEYLEYLKEDEDDDY